jgi:hypothetical protein
MYYLNLKNNCKSGHHKMQNPITLTCLTRIASPGNSYNINECLKFINLTEEGVSFQNGFFIQYRYFSSNIVNFKMGFFAWEVSG